MYGEGNSAKLLSDIVNGTTQVTEGISEMCIRDSPTTVPRWQATGFSYRFV